MLNNSKKLTANMIVVNDAKNQLLENRTQSKHRKFMDEKAKIGCFNF